MYELQSLRKKLKQLSPEIKEEYGVRIIGIFGSIAEGTERQESDIDLLVSFPETATFFDYIDFCKFLEQKLDHTVDVVTEQGVREELQEAIYSQLVRL